MGLVLLKIFFKRFQTFVEQMKTENISNKIWKKSNPPKRKLFYFQFLDENPQNCILDPSRKNSMRLKQPFFIKNIFLVKEYTQPWKHYWHERDPPAARGALCEGAASLCKVFGDGVTPAVAVWRSSCLGLELTWESFQVSLEEKTRVCKNTRFFYVFPTWFRFSYQWPESKSRVFPLSPEY